jgi:hypothetical protein
VIDAEELNRLYQQIQMEKGVLDQIATRLMNLRPGEDGHGLRMEKGRLAGECLSHRLAFLYKIEDAWPEIYGTLPQSLPQESKNG